MGLFFYICTMVNFPLFTKALRAGLSYFAYFFLIFFLSRGVFLWAYGGAISYREYAQDFFFAFLSGARFDVSAVCYGFIPVAVFWLISLFIKPNFSEKFKKIYLHFCRYYLLLVLVVFTAMQMIDFFFYQFFQSRINVLFFGIFNDDTSAVLRSVWTDYPIIKIVFIFALVIFGFLRVHRYISRNWEIQKAFSKPLSIASLLVFPLFVVGIRGSLGEFTLRREHTNVSSNVFINSLCYNAIYALNFAKSELKEAGIYPDIANELKIKGFSSVDEVRNQYQELFSVEIDEDFYVKTPANDFLEKNPPNVVFILMESMSNHYFELHSDRLNLLGDLAKTLPDLYYFKNGLSASNGTIYTLENLLVNSPKGIISQSPYFSVPFRASVARPFQEKGYQTSFITGAHLSWRNVDNLIKNQGFETIEGSSHIKQKNPLAEEFAWGIHDGYLFDHIAENLQKSKKPQFVFSLTVSNHTPYEIPKNYKPYPIDIKEIKDKIRVDEKMANDNFYSHQYAASQLAKFIQKIKNSPLGENTIIVATGDHNIRQIFEYDAENAFMRYSVPMLFYIPERYKPAFFDENVMASHKDIFPTLFYLSLSNQRYVYSGDNLFQKALPYRFGINEYRFMADSIGVLSNEGSVPMYYTWQDQSKRKLKLGNVHSPHAQQMQQKLKVYETALTLRTYMDIEKNKKSDKK